MARELGGVGPLVRRLGFGAAVVTALAVLLAGCSAGPKEPTCEVGYLAVGGECLKICAKTEDCRSEGGLVCIDELCRSPADAECVHGDDCAAAGPCQMPEVRCEAGECVYDACTAGYECVDGTCALHLGLGEVCDGEGCEPGLVCQNGVCCDEAAGTCCRAAADCDRGLGCDTTVWACFTGCDDGDTTRCADPSGTACTADECVAKVALGAACTDDGQCQSGHCVRSGDTGLCCDTACDGECQACGADGLCNDTPADDARCVVACDEELGSACRVYTDPTSDRCASFGQCKVASEDVCADYVDSEAGTPCRDPAGDCDAADVCDGSGSCPDTFLVTGTVCRPAVTGSDGTSCDVAEKCDGASAQCPPDVLVAVDSVCRPAVLEPDGATCDVPERCDGSSALCPANGFVDANLMCRPVAVGTACDKADYCTGTSARCLDGVAAKQTVCRTAAGVCDAVEYCDGSSKLCPADAKLPRTTKCDSGACLSDVYCDGVSNDCDDPSYLAVGTWCGLCAVCDGWGHCANKPASDAACGTGLICDPITCAALGVCSPPAPAGTICEPGSYGTCSSIGICDRDPCQNTCDGQGHCSNCSGGCTSNGSCPGL